MFRRCCFCLPLRYGLLALGYFKMIVDAFVIFFMSNLFIETLWMIILYAKEGRVIESYKGLIISTIALTLFFTDFIVTIVFIVGGHKKNVQLIRVSYFLSVGMWVATSLFAFYTIISMTYMAVTLVAECFFFVVLAVQSYFLLLLRSEIIKLRNSGGEFRSVNNAAEAECTMRCEEVTVATEAVKPDN